MGPALTESSATDGRVYAAYGGVYVTVAILGLWQVDGIPPSGWEILGAIVAGAGMAVIVFGVWKSA